MDSTLDILHGAVSAHTMKIRRTDDFINLVAIVGVLNLSLIAAVGTEYGNLPFYGVTDPLWVGVLIEFLFSTSYFLQWASVLDALASRFYSLQYNVPCQLNSVYLMAAAWGLYMLLLFFMDRCYWFNLYVITVEFELEVGNTPMYLADTVPTIGFAVGLPAWIHCVVRVNHARSARPRLPVNGHHSIRHAFVAARSPTPLAYQGVRTL